VPELTEDELAELPTLEELEELSTDELDDLLGLTPKFDIPPAARRSMRRVGVIDLEEGGFPERSLARQPASLVRAALAGTDRPLVSRWGHILLRRALASRLAPPQGMSPVEFAALRTRTLNSIGEFTVARALVQDVDTGNWDDALTASAVDAYIATADFVGACPAIRLRRATREDADWVLLTAICNAYAGDTSLANAQLVRAANDGIAPEIDVRLAQRFAGAAGRGRRGVEIEWDNVSELNRWRFALANALGEPIPEALLEAPEPYYARAAAGAAMISLSERAAYAGRAAGEGILSSRALVELYSQIYADQTISGDAAEDAIRLRAAYVAPEAGDRLAAMKALWQDGDAVLAQGRYAMTAYAAARFTPSESFSADAGELIASMLTAGLDRDALSWSNVVEPGSMGWALIMLSRRDGPQAELDAVDQFLDQDQSEDLRKSAFLVAGLAGLGRVSSADRDALVSSLDLGLARQTIWTRAIAQAADVRNPALVAMLAGLGMQGSDWQQMTPLHLFHIVDALRRVGLGAEARMIAAEAVARG